MYRRTISAACKALNFYIIQSAARDFWVGEKGALCLKYDEASKSGTG